MPHAIKYATDQGWYDAGPCQNDWWIPLGIPQEWAPRLHQKLDARCAAAAAVLDAIAGLPATVIWGSAFAGPRIPLVPLQVPQALWLLQKHTAAAMSCCRTSVYYKKQAAETARTPSANGMSDNAIAPAIVNVQNGAVSAAEAMW